MKDYSHIGKVKNIDLVSCNQSLSLLLHTNNTAWDFLLTALYLKSFFKVWKTNFRKKNQFNLGYNLLARLILQTFNGYIN